LGAFVAEDLFDFSDIAGLHLVPVNRNDKGTLAGLGKDVVGPRDPRETSNHPAQASTNDREPNFAGHDVSKSRGRLSSDA
jgi:hypothetical protein